MLSIYQRADESTRPDACYSNGIKHGQDVDLRGEDDGEPFELVEIEMRDSDEHTFLWQVKEFPLPVFIGLRQDADGEDYSISLGAPDTTPGIGAEQLAADQLECAHAATETAAPHYREKLVAIFGLLELGQPGAGPRALRPRSAASVGSISVNTRFADGDTEQFTLSEKLPAIILDTAAEKVYLASSPFLFATNLYMEAAKTMHRLNIKTRKRLCAEYGIQMPRFFSHE